MQKIAIYPGSFDPVTWGHINIAFKAINTFDKLHVVVFNNENKKHLFSLDERYDMLLRSLWGIPEIKVSFSDGSLLQYCRDNHITHIVRGLRNVSDFTSEIQIATANHDYLPTVETVFFTPDSQYAHISSSLVRSYASIGEGIEKYVPENIIDTINQKFSQR